MSTGSPVAIDIAVEAGDWPDEARLRALSSQAAEATFAALGLSAPASELSLLFTDDGPVRELNARWRGKDSPTNVLSFPALPIALGDAAPPLLGDIVLAFTTVSREAALEGKAFEHHLLHLVVHGLLHLLGHDHEDERQAEIMEDHERRILARLGIADPYA